MFDREWTKRKEKKIMENFCQKAVQRENMIYWKMKHDMEVR